MNPKKLNKKIEKNKRKIRVRWGVTLAEKKRLKETALNSLTDQNERENAEYLFNELIRTIEDIRADLEKPEKYLLKKYEMKYKEALKETEGKKSEEIERDHILTLAFNKSLLYAQVVQDLGILLL